MARGVVDEVAGNRDRRVHDQDAGRGHPGQGNTAAAGPGAAQAGRRGGNEGRAGGRGGAGPGIGCGGWTRPPLARRSTKHEEAAHERRNWVRLTFVRSPAAVFCLDAHTHDGTNGAREEVDTQILDGRRKGAERLILSGGEPTIHRLRRLRAPRSARRLSQGPDRDQRAHVRVRGFSEAVARRGARRGSASQSMGRTRRSTTRWWARRGPWRRSRGSSRRSRMGGRSST